MIERFSVDPRLNSALDYLTEKEREHGITHSRLLQLLDIAWHEVARGSNPPTVTEDFLNTYYRHPIWLINGLFSDSDSDTVSDRLAAIRMTAHVKPKRLLDFGGGYGTGCRLAAQTLSEIEEIHLLDVGEDHHAALSHLKDYPQVKIVAKPEPPYDAVISTEVFEHLTDPVGSAHYIHSLLRPGGALAASWSFAPGIECHLPRNFHLARSMVTILRSLGFGFYGFERRGSTVCGFVRSNAHSEAALTRARYLERLSRFCIPLDRISLVLKGL